MPSSQIQSCGPTSQINNASSKLPPPNKPPPPPPPPPRNSSQLSCQTSISSNQLCGGLLVTSSNGSGILNNGSSMSSLNSAGRCNHQQPLTGPAGSSSLAQRGFSSKHADNFSSRSSVSSHGSSLHHHHNHHSNNNLSSVQLSSSSSLSSLQPVDPNSFVHRCSISQQNNIAPPASVSIKESILRPASTVNNCNHIHRTNAHACNHHHPTSFCHHMQSVIEQQVPLECGRVNCLHTHIDCNNCHRSPNVLIGKSCASDSLHHQHYDLHQEHSVTANRTSDISNNDSLLSTAHTHNLSNSSTTTHTSNVAVKHQPQFHRPVLSQGGRSNSSQQYEQYCLSSAASTSSATASLSSYQTPAGFEDLVPLYPSSKINQPLPPPPPPHLKSRPQSPQQMLFNTTNAVASNSIPASNIISNNNNNNHSYVNNNNNNGSMIITTRFVNSPQLDQQLSYNQPSLPPKRYPPKPTSPNASACSTQITTVRTSPSLHNQPITRVTSQAGVQNPLPSSDVPPPLPPLNLGSRPQPLVNSHMTRIHQIWNENIMATNCMPNTTNINPNQRQTGINMQSAIDRKAEVSNIRQVEVTADNQQHQKNGESTRICPKCSEKVTIGQDACKAMNQIYHATCMVCCVCNRTLVGETFYPVDDKVYCVEDFKFTGHMQPLEKCAACFKPISTMILPAMGKSYHPECFKCCTCGQCLDGVPFTIDMKNKIYCVKDYHNIYSPKCAACGKSISPLDGTSETVRVVSMNKDYHIDCYCCEDCGLQLTDEEPSRSYPLDNHLLCQRCHINRLSKQMQPALSLS